jgi:histidinol-phosphate aminotransferase
MNADRPAPNPAALRFLRPEVVAMRPYTPGEQAQDCIKLNTNECPWPPAPAVRDVLSAVADDTLRLYPDPVHRRLRAAAAALYGTGADQVLAGNGSDDCLTVIYRAFLNPGDRVAVPWPTYGLYDTLSALQGVAVEHIDWAAGWRLPDGLARVGAKLVLVANPNNPSATLVPVADLRRLCDRVDGIVVVDEAYVDFALVEDPTASILPHLDAHPNLVVLRTCSKSYSLAGARLGLAFAAAPLVAQFLKVKDSYNVNALTQALGIAGLNDRDHHREVMRKTVAERERLAAALAGFGWSWPPSRGNFLLCSVGPRAGDIYRALKARGILVRWWDTPQLADKLRITVGRPEQTDRLVAALREIG